MTSGAQPVWGAVVVAAGRGQRFGPVDKLLASLDGRPVIAWSVDGLLSDGRFREIVVVTGRENGDSIRDALGPHLNRLPITFCTGGATRSASVSSGLAALSAAITHVAVHDGARPLASAALVRDVLDGAERSGAAVPGLPPVASIGLASDDRKQLAGQVDRSSLLELQTPQAATFEALVDALTRFPDETDESTALFKAGYSVSLVAGMRSNLKITVPDDLVVALALVGNRVALP